VLPQAEKKFSGFAQRSAILQEDWPQIRAELASFGIPTSQEIRTILQAARAPSTLVELNLEKDEAIDALSRARDIRDRYTVLDLAFELGFFPAGISQVMAHSGV
jgi:glycerol-1-phosphate dehydrogenase [NAD(P)+]